MFRDKEILEELGELKRMVLSFERKINTELSEVDKRVKEFEQIEMKVDKKLIDFHKEFIDKYFDNLNAFLRWNKEIALVSYIGGKDPNISNLKRELMKPYLEEKWSIEKAKQAEDINKVLNSKGEEIRKKREQLQSDYLEADRKGRKDDALIYKAQYEILDRILEVKAE